MLTREEFVRRILDGALPATDTESSDDSGAGMLDGFDAFEVPDNSPTRSRDARFAQLLLEESGFGRGETLPREEVVLGDQKTNRFLPHGATYWSKTTERPFHILLFDIEANGSAILGDSFFRQNDQLEDVLHRIVQDALEGFERGGEGRTADRKKGAQSETLCVVSVVDDRGDGLDREIVCFGTKCTETEALEVFTLREEARDWDRPLAEEHLGQLFERHFRRLGTGARWQDAFVSGDERKKARMLMEECARPAPDEKQLQTAIRDLLDEIAGSFGLRRKGGRGGHRLVMHALPEDHSIAVNPDDARTEGFKNPFQGVRIFDAEERLIGYIVYVLDTKSEAERLRRQLAQHNHFHNVLVVYPEEAGATLELWQGSAPLRGRLIGGARRSRFDGEGGVVQLLSRFFVVSRSEIRTPQQLARELAWRAQHLKALALDELHEEKDKPKEQRPLRELLDVFNKALATLNEEEFADAYAQTITYGLLAARWLSSGREDARFTRKNIDALLPSTSPFLHDLFQRLLNSRFDQNLSWLLDDVTSLLSRTMVAEVFQGEADPSIHFYQDFLDVYDPDVRAARGVYYTPDSVVHNIVHRLHARLINEFGLPLGLADPTSWSEVASKADLLIPDGVSGTSAFVRVLDPATGTGTFLKHCIELIHSTMVTHWSAMSEPERAIAWTAYVRGTGEWQDRGLLSRLSGFEILMAPYIVCHLRLGLLLAETGFSFERHDRIQVFLTNTLEPASSKQLQILGDAIAQESLVADRLKTDDPITVFLGNPPYQNLGDSNRGEWILTLLDLYKEGLKERKINLDDDFIKFMRWTDHRVSALGVGMVGYVTPHTYLGAVTRRRMREVLLDVYDSISIIDLHGNIRRQEVSPDGSPDENVFDIQQGIAIGIMCRRPGERTSQVFHYDLWGTRQDKFRKLSMWPDVECQEARIHPSPDLYLLLPNESDLADAYGAWPSLENLFSRRISGVQTKRDKLTIQRTPNEVETVLQDFVSLSESEIRDKYNLRPDGRDWKVRLAKDDVRSGELVVTSIAYRPFDARFTAYGGRSKGFLAYPRTQIMPALLLPENVGFVFKRQARRDAYGYTYFFVVNTIISEGLFSVDPNGREYVAPLWLRSSDGSTAGLFGGDSNRTCNLNLSEVSRLLEPTGRRYGVDVTAREVLAYIYGVCHSAGYRLGCADLLRRDYPRIPPAQSRLVFRKVAEQGEVLLRLHLEWQDYKASRSPSLIGTGDNLVAGGFPTYEDGHVAISRQQSFHRVAPEVWEARIGGYQVAKKWLSDRRRTSLSEKEIADYAQVLCVIEATLVAIAGVDRAVEGLGGWSECFVERAADGRV